MHSPDPRLPAEFLTPITLRLQDTNSERVGILPFRTAPDVIVWQNRVFIPWEMDLDFDYTETTFAIAECKNDDAVWVRLETADRQFVAGTTVPNCEPLPSVIRWGERIFKLSRTCVYNEAFFAIAYNLETQTPELFVHN